MGIKLFLLFAALTIPVSSSAQEPDWPQNPVLGLIGASFINNQTPHESIFGGFATAGGSYLDLETALNQSFAFVLSGVRSANEAQAGAFSFDLDATGTLGYKSQFDRILNQTVSPLEDLYQPPVKLKVLYIGLMNDCLHAQMCDYNFSLLINNVQDVIDYARSMEVPVIITGYPEYDDFDGDLYVSTYAPLGVSRFISEAEYYELRSAHRDAFEDQAGVTYVNLYEGGRTIDGIHWDAKTMRRAAKRLTTAVIGVLYH